MVTDAQEHALAWRWRSHPSIPGIAGTRPPQPNSSARPSTGARPSTALDDDLDLGGSSTKGLVSQGSSPRRPGAAATPEGGAPIHAFWSGLGHCRPGLCGPTDLDPSLEGPHLTPLL